MIFLERAPLDSMVTDAKGPPRGLICPLVTPLKTGDLIDSSVLERLIRHVGQGADAILLGDMYWGEGLALSFSTRLELFCAALEIIQGKWPIFINITSRNSKETRMLAAHTGQYLLARLSYLLSQQPWFAPVVRVRMSRYQHCLHIG